MPESLPTYQVAGDETFLLPEEHRVHLLNPVLPDYIKHHPIDLKIIKPVPGRTVTSPAPPFEHLDWTSGLAKFEAIPLTGEASLRFQKNGDVEFAGHFDNHGALTYRAIFVYVIVGHDGAAFTFSHGNDGLPGGLMNNGAWNLTANSSPITQHWWALCAGWHARWVAGVNSDAASLLSSCLETIKASGTPVNSVIAVLPDVKAS